MSPWRSGYGLLRRRGLRGRQLMTGRYLLDASALYPLVLRLRENLLGYSSLFVVLDLTVYEVGNVIWKEYLRGKIRDPVVVANLFQEIFNIIPVLRLNANIHEVLGLAINENLTFYDASYLYMARIHGAKLVTEDRDLQRFPESISVRQLLNELGLQPR